RHCAPVPLSLSVLTRRPPRSPLFPYTTLFRSADAVRRAGPLAGLLLVCVVFALLIGPQFFRPCRRSRSGARPARGCPAGRTGGRSEEHTSELQSLTNLVCRLLLEKKKITPYTDGEEDKPQGLHAEHGDQLRRSQNRDRGSSYDRPRPSRCLHTTTQTQRHALITPI